MSSFENKRTYTELAPETLAHTLAEARGGDQQAFSLLTEPHRLELLTHCYRMLGSIEDAEDQVQETFLRAWKGIDTYEGRASFRAWLYKIATNSCLDALKNHPKRTLPPNLTKPVILSDPLPNPKRVKVWIEPFPEELLAPISSNPEARYDAYEAISLAFLVALHVLPARQRTVLILSDVLGWPLAEIADALDTTLSSVTSLLHRARETMKQRNMAGKREGYRVSVADHQTKQLLERYLQAWEAADIEGIVALLTDDATFPMPPYPIWVQGKPAIQVFIGRTILSGEAQKRYKLIPIRASGQPGYAFYQLDEHTRQYQPFAIHLLAIENGLISEAITFGFPSLFRFFNLPPSIPY